MTIHVSFFPFEPKARIQDETHNLIIEGRNEEICIFAEFDLTHDQLARICTIFNEPRPPSAPLDPDRPF